ncbi:hypothetical protein F4801DRAFT_207135 [Xylaria longipes]|nr:hypothetical protein F4801DRAFT_207135 [Xylaria longipes]RYC61975.1 hypothetical protein CHU98_g4247 [Xylaria longipes]
MEFENISLLSTVLVAFYLLPAVCLTFQQVSECIGEAETRELQSWWITDSFARFVVVSGLSISLFIFYLIFTIPLLAYRLCRLYGASLLRGTGAENYAWYGRPYCGGYGVRLL